MTIPKGNWLRDLIWYCVEQRLCVEIICTTCGCREFKDRLLSELSKNCPNSSGNGERIGRGYAICLLAAFQHLAQQQLPSGYDTIHVTRVLIYKCWAALGGDEALPEMQSILNDSWAAGVLESMVAHQREVERHRQEHRERSDPEKARLRREKAKAERQLAHKMRQEHFRALWLARLGAQGRSSSER